MIKRGFLWIPVIVMAACSDPELEARLTVLTDSLARATAERDSLSALLRRLEESPDHYLVRARAARVDGSIDSALKFVDQLIVRFPDAPEARAARQLRAEIRAHVADSLRAVAEQGLEKGNLQAARRALEQLKADWSDTPAARRLPSLMARLERAERVAEQQREAERKRAEEARARAGSQLELLDWRWSRSYGYAIAEGRVKNISGQRLENVVAEVTWYDRSGGFITADEALISLNPILPGQASTFKVIAVWNPAMNSASISFKKLFGSSIPTYRPSR